MPISRSSCQTTTTTSTTTTLTPPIVSTFLQAQPGKWFKPRSFINPLTGPDVLQKTLWDLSHPPTTSAGCDRPSSLTYTSNGQHAHCCLELQAKDKHVAGLRFQNKARQPKCPRTGQPENSIIADSIKHKVAFSAYS